MTDFNLDSGFDFGFTSMSSDELQAPLQMSLEAAQNKAQQMYNAIVPLLNNLAKDSDKNDIIKWPGRAKTIAEFKKKLEAILNS